jgi:DNA-binding transcriptional LysR family regulator
MDRLEAMRTFVAVAEERSFAAAGRRLRASAPAVTRAVAALEARVGARLLHRTTRVVRVTEIGRRFLRDAKRILSAVDEAEASASGAHAALRGPLSVTAPVMFGRIHVTPVLLDFLSAHPDVTARAMLVDRVVDLVEEEIDVAVRIAELGDSTLSAVRVGSVRRVVCASPDYLRKGPKLKTPRDLPRHESIGFQPALGWPDWRFKNLPETATRPRARLLVNNADVAIDFAVAGRGLVRTLSYMVARHIREGSLTVVLPTFEPPPIPVHVVHGEGRRASARVRAYVDFASERLRAALR